LCHTLGIDHEASLGGRYFQKKKCERLLAEVERATDAARKSKKQRGELSLDDLFYLGEGLRLALEGKPVPAFREQYPDDKRPREMYLISPQEQVAIHVLLARKGLIVDRAPIKTALAFLKTVYGIERSKQTIRNWVADQEASPTHYVRATMELVSRHRAADIADLRVQRRSYVLSKVAVWLLDGPGDVTEDTPALASAAAFCSEKLGEPVTVDMIMEFLEKLGSTPGIDPQPDVEGE